MVLRLQWGLCGVYVVVIWGADGGFVIRGLSRWFLAEHTVASLQVSSGLD